MAERSATADRLTERSQMIVWSGLLNGDTGAPFERTDFADRSVQISGSFGTGGTIAVQGSNNGAGWHTLTDPQGNALSFAAAGLEQVAELTRYIRPAVTAGDGTTALTVTMLARA